jgi:hypothetical protein
MEYKKMKKAEATIQGSIMSIIILIGIFTGLFIYMTATLQDSNVVVDAKYNDTYNKLLESQSDLDDLRTELKDKSDKISEADQGWQVALNGLLGLGTALKAPFKVVETGEKTIEAMNSNLDVVPAWAKNLAILAITLTIILILLAVWKGDQKVI